MGWQTTKSALLTTHDGKIIAYDWNGAKLWESKSVSKAQPFEMGDYFLLVGGETETASGIPPAPYRLGAVNKTTGQAMWMQNDLKGKKIDNFEVLSDGLIRIQAGELSSTIRIADGKPVDDTVAGVTEGSEDPVSVIMLKKGLQGRTASGKLVWERKGDRAWVPQPKNGLAIWAASDGTVEVIDASTGATKWKANVGKEPRVVTNPDWTYMLARAKQGKEVTIVKLAQ